MQMCPLDNLQYWDQYALDHTSNYNHEMAKFIKDLAVSLRAQRILEVGCSAGNDLRLFPEDLSVSGIDISHVAIKKAKENLVHFDFKVGDVTRIPFADNSVDIVFTRNLFNYVDAIDIKKAIDELHRVSQRYIFNIELFSENEEEISNERILTFGRNMKKHWLDYKVKIISNVEMHEKIDPNKSRFTLLRKI